MAKGKMNITVPKCPRPSLTEVRAAFKSAHPDFEFEHGPEEVDNVYHHLKSNGDLPATAKRAAEAIFEFIGGGM